MKKLLSGISLIVMSVCFWACSKGYLDINSPNPNLATSATPELVITNAMTTSAAPLVAKALFDPITFQSGWLGYWEPSGSYAQNNSDVASYKQTTQFADYLWVYYYRNLADYYYVENAAKQQLKPYYTAMAKTMKSLVFQQLVDFFNNVPYSQAFQGTLNITPKYDSAQSIYLDLAKQCDSAVALMASPAATATTGSSSPDRMFEGNNLLWEQFANTLHLRILIRQTQIPGISSYITSEIAKILANGAGFLAQDASIDPPYANNTGQQNPVYGFFVTTAGLPTSGGQADYWRASTYSLNYLKGTNDPRLSRLYDTTAAGTYVGSTLGSITNPSGQLTSSIGPGLLNSVSQPAIFLSAAESYFLQAEAMVRGYLPGGAMGAQAAYNSGVQASFTYLGAGDATAYLAQSNIAYPVSGTMDQQIASIIRQKWIADNGVTPIESYDDYRRLGLPSDIPLSISGLRNSNTVPTRLLYPVSEYTTNTVNVNAQGTIDYITGRVFWNQ
jgi:hypothetical protein